MPSSKRQISDAKPHLQRVDDNAFHLNVLRGVRSNSNSVVTIAETRDTNYTNRHEALDRSNPCRFLSGADGISETEGKAATGSGERAGRQASFKFVFSVPRKSKKKLAKISGIP